MIADLKPYPKYKKSGTSWLSDVPAHWEVQRNGRLFAQRNETGFPDLPILEVSLKTGVRVRDFVNSNRKQVIAEREKYKRAQRGDIAYNMMRMWQGAVGVTPVDGLVSPAYVVARPLPGTQPFYFQHLFCTPAYKGVVNTFSRGIVSDRNRLYWEDFKQIPSPVPPPNEQEAIALFLDHANARIERALRAKRKLIALLNEQKQVIIHRAVTRGLEPVVKLKPSGKACLGDIPCHWEVRRLRSLAVRIEQGVSPLADNSLAGDSSWGVLKAGCVNGGVFRETQHKRLAPDFRIDPTIVVKVGDILVSRACGSPRLVGSAGKVESLTYHLILSDKTFRPVFRDFVDVDYLVLAMNSRSYRDQVQQAISGAEGLANNLPLSSLRDFVFAIPPLKEARRISAFLKDQLRAQNVAIARIEREIAFLLEYRTTLTADVVTGKLDVRDAVKSLPTSAEQPTAPDGPDVPDDTDDELTEFAE